MKKRILSVLLCVAMTASMVIGCGGKSDSNKDNTTEGSENTTETNQLVMPVSATVTSMNRLLESMAEGWFQLAGFSDELYYAAVDETRYYLAESCTVSDDGLTYTVKLRDNLKWHDGEAITADDILFTIACVADTNNGASFTNVAYVGEDEVKVEKVDDLTATFTLKEPSASYFELLGHLILIPEHAFGGNTDIVSAEANLTDIGSGPYKLVEFNDGESLVLGKFEDYYGDDAQIDTLIYKVIGDASSQEVAFQNGEINYLSLSSDAAAQKYSAMDNVTVHSLPEGRVNYLAWNKYCATWENKDAVKAVFLALNQDEIVKAVYGNAMGVAANTIFSNQNLFHDSKVKGYSQDLETAKSLAESAGLAGKTITLYYNQDRVYMKETALIIQQQLKAINVNVDVQGVESSAFFDIVFTDQADYELYLNGYGATGDPDSVVHGMYNGTWGINVDTSKEILDLFEKGSVSTDEAERQEIYSQLQQLAVDEYLVYPIAYPNLCFATSSNLQGVEELTTTPVFEDFTKLYFKLRKKCMSA